MACAACGAETQIDRPCENCGFCGMYYLTPVFARDPNFLPLTKEAKLFATQFAEQFIAAQESRELIN